VSSCALVGSLGVASAARADVDFQIAMGAGASWIRSMPALKTTGLTSTAARDVPPGKVALGGSLVALGGSLDIAVSADDRFIFPLLGFAGYGAVGSYDRITTSLDGSIASVRPWSAYQLDVLLPGIGYRLKRRRFLFSAGLRTGIEWLAAGGSVAAGAESAPITLIGVAALVRAELEACRRLDPATRVCVQVAPRIYDFGFLNGATFAVRVEWGR
jgi:hypothetical protein